MFSGQRSAAGEHCSESVQYIIIERMASTLRNQHAGRITLNNSDGCRTTHHDDDEDRVFPRLRGVRRGCGVLVLVVLVRHEVVCRRRRCSKMSFVAILRDLQVAIVVGARSDCGRLRAGGASAPEPRPRTRNINGDLVPGKSL